MNDMNFPLVTILIPCYNANNTIISALLSVRSQNYNNIEVIIVDDGSIPQVPNNLVKEFSDINLKIVCNATNMGIVAALNNGLKNSSGSIILRLDADDEMLKDRIVNQVNSILFNNVDVVFSQMHVNGQSNVYYYPVTHNAIVLCMLYGNPIPHPAVAIKAHILKDNLYLDFNGVKGLEDYYLWARVIRSGGRFLGDSLFCTNYIESNGQISKRTVISKNYIDAKNKISLINSNIKDYNDRFKPRKVFDIISSLDGFDLLAFRQISISALKMEIRTRQDIIFFLESLFTLIILYFYKRDFFGFIKY